MAGNLPSKRRRYAGGVDPLTSPQLPRELFPFTKDARVQRANKTKGWRCKYCGAKLINKQYGEPFTLGQHLDTSPDCKKQYTKEING